VLESPCLCERRVPVAVVLCKKGTCRGGGGKEGKTAFLAGNGKEERIRRCKEDGGIKRKWRGEARTFSSRRQGEKKRYLDCLRN